MVVVVQTVARGLVGWPDDWCGRMTGGTRYMQRKRTWMRDGIDEW